MTRARRHVFTETELDQIKSLLKQVRRSDRDRQKSLRNQLRRMGFYISDYATDQAGFTASDVDRLVARGTITVASSRTSSPIPQITDSDSATTRAAPPQGGREADPETSERK